MISNKLNLNHLQTLKLTKDLQHSIQILQFDIQDIFSHLSKLSEENPFINLNYDFLHFISDEQINQTAVHHKTLAEHLISQLNNTHSNQIDIYHFLIHSLNEKGFLEISKEEIKEKFKLSSLKLAKIFDNLYKLDPPGCFAYSLIECLELQLKRLKAWSEDYQLLLPALIIGDINKISLKTKLSLEKINEMLSVAKSLDPYPGVEFSNAVTIVNYPEAEIYFESDGRIAVKLCIDTSQILTVNRDLFQYSKSINTRHSNNFIKEKYNEASLVEKALNQRQATIIKVVTKIATLQNEMMEKGISYQKPLTLREVAAETNMHESTISRLSNKGVITPVGYFKIKQFFSSTIKANFTENIFSATAVKNKIQYIVAKESKPLSDDEIAAELGNSGIKIARRTVAKYRDAMNIPPSTQRLLKMI